MSVLDSPWKITNHLARIVSTPALRLQFLLSGIEWGDHWRIFGAPMIQRHRGSSIELGSYLELRSSPRSNPLTPQQPVVFSTRSPQATIKLGDHCGLTGVVIVAEREVLIGDHVLIGANTVITDTDFHPLSPESRRSNINAGESAPIHIENDVFIGTQAIILKGVTIGTGAVIGARSVVTKDVAPRSIVAGNPAREVGRV